MGLFDKIKEPIFLKESDSESKLNELQQLLRYAPSELVEQIEQEIKFVEAGIFGENTIKFELKNSHIPMYVLHDLYLTHGDLSAQIDFLIITRKHIYVIECKNLYGDIEITSTGDFIRTFSFGNFKKKEGIYSPITQNMRHLQLIKQIRGAEYSNILSKSLFERNFYNNYHSIVVLANPKTVLNAKFAKKDVKDRVIRADQLSSYIKKIDSDPRSSDFSEKDMELFAKFFIDNHKENKTDYLKKFKEMAKLFESKITKLESTPITASKTKSVVEKTNAKESLVCTKCGSTMIRRVATKGPNPGNEFYGCSNFPKCKNVIPIKPN